MFLKTTSADRARVLSDKFQVRFVPFIIVEVHLFSQLIAQDTRDCLQEAALNSLNISSWHQQSDYEPG